MPGTSQALPGKAVPVLVQHGALDPVISVEEGRALAGHLANLGHSVTFREYPMGHQVSEKSLTEASTWLSALLETL